jgi:hypothetical protein
MKLTYIAFFFVLMFGNSFASMVIIQDNYIGGRATNSSYVDVDIIGTYDSFDVSYMAVDLDKQARNLSVSIYSNYMDNIGMFDTQLGDLFLSTDGWKPQGSVSNGYNTDTYKSGEWNYIVALDKHLGTGGSVNLYAITDTNVKMSWANNGYIYRSRQAVQGTNLNGLTSLGTGFWSVDTINKVLNLSIGFGNTFNDVDNLAFHWGMTCANDVIEGTANFAAVPEPGLIVLVLIGIGVLFFRYRFQF